MFQFPRLPPTSLCVQLAVTGNDSRRVRPFGDPRVERACAPNRGLSQLVASFVGFLCQGIHRLPLPSSFSDGSNILKVSRRRFRAAASSDAIFFEENLSSRYAALKVRPGCPGDRTLRALGRGEDSVSGTDGASVNEVVIF